MKNKHIIFALATTLICLCVSCKKKDPAPIPAHLVQTIAPINHGTCTYTINGTTTFTADSIHWDNYNGTTPRVQAFIGSLAVITLWPSGVTTHTQSLSSQYVYWIPVTSSNTVYTASTGTLNLTNTSNILSGSISSNGTKWSGSGTAPTSTIVANFSDARKIGV